MQEKQIPPKNSSMKSITRIVSLLRALSHDNSKLADISKATGLSRGTVYRLLQALKTTGLVIEDSINHTYYLGYLFHSLSLDASKIHQYIIGIARSRMQNLVNVSHETVNLHIAAGIERVRLLTLVGTHNITYVGNPNIVSTIWVGAVGKVLLAQLPDNEMNTIIDNITLFALTPYTITDKEVLKREIYKVRQQGFATSINEGAIGVASICVPVYNYAVPASLSIVAPLERFASNMMDYLPDLRKNAREISDELLDVYNPGNNLIHSQKDNVITP